MWYPVISRRADTGWSTVWIEETLQSAVWLVIVTITPWQTNCRRTVWHHFFRSSVSISNQILFKQNFKYYDDTLTDETLGKCSLFPRFNPFDRSISSSLYRLIKAHKAVNVCFRVAPQRSAGRPPPRTQSCCEPHQSLRRTLHLCHGVQRRHR